MKRKKPGGINDKKSLNALLFPGRFHPKIKKGGI